MSSTAEWYYLRDGEQVGPVGSRELKGLADRGRLQPTDLIWRDGLPDWVPAARVKGLFPDTDVYGLEEEPAALPPARAEEEEPAALPPARAEEDEEFAPGGVRPKAVKAPRHGYASVWKRFVALIIDGFVLFGIAFPIAFVLVVTLGPGRVQEVMETNRALMNLIGLAVNCLYFASMESSERQATVGKRAMRIRVVDLSGDRISFRRAVGRWFGKNVSLLVFIVALIVAAVVSQNLQEFQGMAAGALLVFLVVLLGGYLLAFFTPRKQALHDLLAKTLVVND